MCVYISCVPQAGCALFSRTVLLLGLPFVHRGQRIYYLLFPVYRIRSTCRARRSIQTLEAFGCLVNSFGPRPIITIDITGELNFAAGPLEASRKPQRESPARERPVLQGSPTHWLDASVAGSIRRMSIRHRPPRIPHFKPSSVMIQTTPSTATKRPRLQPSSRPSLALSCSSEDTGDEPHPAPPLEDNYKRPPKQALSDSSKSHSPKRRRLVDCCYNGESLPDNHRRF